MGNSSDSDQHRAVSKNGKDQAQDRKLDEMHTEFKEFAKADLESHGKLYEALHKIETHFEKAVERLEGKLNAHKMIAVVLWTVFVVLGGWAVSRAGHIVDTLTDKVQAIDARTQADWANGRKWGERLDKDVDRVERTHKDDMDRVDRQIGRLRRGLPLQEERE